MKKIRSKIDLDARTKEEWSAIMAWFVTNKESIGKDDLSTVSKISQAIRMQTRVYRATDGNVIAMLDAHQLRSKIRE